MDGRLTSADFPADTFFNGFNHMIVMRADADGDDQVTRAEWDAFGARFDPNRDGEIAVEEAAGVLGRWASDWRLFLLSFDQDGDGRFSTEDLDLTFRDQDFDGNGTLAGREVQGWQPATEDGRDAPAPGSQAPEITLSYAADASKAFQLSAAVTERPVALVFGSYT